jgi:uncharacterized protein (TIGR02246 family)
MKFLRYMMIGVVLSGLATGDAARAQAPAQAYTAGPQQMAVSKILQAQQDEWNQGDMDGYLSHFKNASDTQAILSGSVRGLEAIRAAFETNFPNAESMGRLEQSEMEVRPLGEDFVLATGKFRLSRPKKRGGDSGGIFTEIFEKTDKGWKIIYYSAI